MDEGPGEEGRERPDARQKASAPPGRVFGDEVGRIFSDLDPELNRVKGKS